MFDENVDDEQGIDVGDWIIPAEFVGRLVAAMLRVPVPDRGTMLQANLAEWQAVRDRGDRSGSERLAAQRRWIEMEWT